MTSRWKRYWLIFLLVCLLLPTHRYVFGPSAGGEFSNDAGKTPGYFLIEMILIIFLSFIFLSAFFLAFRRRLLNGGFWRGYFFTVLALMFFLILFKFPARPQQMVVSLLFEVGLIFFCFVSGRYLMKKISAGPAYPLRKVLFFAVFWAGWVTFFYAFFKFWGLAQFSGGSPAKVNILFYFFSVLAGSIWASISEETIYRLYLINFLQSLGLGNFFPVVFSAVFWALAHAGGEVHPFYLRMIEIFPVGIGLGFLYLKFGYFFVLAVHFLTDLILMGLPGIYVSSWLVVPFLGLMLISAALVFLACHQKPSVTRLWMKAGLASGAILKKSKMVFLFAAIFLMFLVFNNSVEAMNLKEFCTGVFEKDLSLGQTRARFEIEELNRKLLKSNRYPKISFYIRSERLNLPDFWVRSLKDSLPTLENLGTDRWQVQSGLTGNWLLYDPLNLYKEKLAVRRCQINQQELADSEAKFYLENFRLFLDLARIRLLKKTFLCWEGALNCLDRVLEAKIKILLSEKFQDIFGQIQEARAKIQSLLAKERLLTGEIRQRASLDFIETQVEEKLLEEVAGLNFSVKMNKKFPKLSEKITSSGLPFQVSLEGRYFYYGEEASFGKSVNNLAPGWQAAVNINLDLFNENGALERKINYCGGQLEYLQYLQKIEEATQQVARFDEELAENQEKLRKLKERSSRLQTGVQRDQEFFRQGLVLPENFGNSLLVFLSSREAFLERSFGTLVKLGEILSITGEIKNWVEKNYEKISD